MPKHIFNPAAVSASGGKSLAFKSAVVLSCFFLAYGTVILFVEPFLGDFMVAPGPNVGPKGFQACLRCPF